MPRQALGNALWRTRLSVAIEDTSPDLIVLSREYLYKSKLGHSKTTRTFAAIHPDAALNIAKNDNHLYEIVVTDRPRKLYFDMDIKCDANELDDEMVYRNDVVNMVKEHFGDVDVVLSGSAHETSDGKGKISYHVVVPSVVYDNHGDMLHHIHNYVTSDAMMDDADRAVYDRNRAMKMINQSKASDTRRVQHILVGEDPRDHFITAFFPSDARKVCPNGFRMNVILCPTMAQKTARSHQPFNIDDVVVTLDHDITVPDTWSITSPPAETLALFPLETVRQNRLLELSLIRWAKTRNATFDDWCRFAKPRNTEKHYEMWGRALSNKPLYDNELIALLQQVHPTAELDNQLLRSLRRYHDIHPTRFICPHPRFKFFRWKADQPRPDDEIETYERENAKPRLVTNDISDKHVTAWWLSMGSGKTTVMLMLAKQNPKARILIITCRVALVRDTVRRNKEIGGRQLASYLKIRHGLGEESFAIIQAESLWRIAGCKPYDYLFIDEFETFANGWKSETHRKLRNNWETLIQMWRQAGKVVVMDAILTRKTMDFVEELGDEIEVIGNENPPHTRKMVYINPKGSTVLNAGIDHIAEQLRNGKNLIVHYPYVMPTPTRPGIEGVMMAVLAKSGLSLEEAVYYTAGQEDNILKQFYDVEEAWTKKRLIISTSYLSVGVSFSSEHFDACYVFKHGFVNPRDLLQFTYRVRRLRDETVYVLRLNERSCESETIYEIDDPLYMKMQAAAQFERIHNTDECFRFIAEKCGYVIVDDEKYIDEQLQNDSSVQTAFESERLFYRWESIDDIDADEAKNIRKRVMSHNATAVEKLRLQKYFHRQRFDTDNESLIAAWWESGQSTLMHVYRFRFPKRDPAPTKMRSRVGEGRARDIENIIIEGQREIDPFDEHEREHLREAFKNIAYLRHKDETTLNRLCKAVFGVNLMTYDVAHARHNWNENLLDSLRELMLALKCRSENDDL